MNEKPRRRPNRVFMNQVMINILRSPLHGLMSKDIMVITFAGRKSGDLFSTPVSYLRQGSEVTVLTRSSWWKNVVGGKPVTLTIRGKKYHGVAEAFTQDKQAVEEAMRVFLKEKPANARFYKVNMGPDGTPDPAQVQLAVQNMILVKISLS